jgi:hypothetical protein
MDEMDERMMGVSFILDQKWMMANWILYHYEKIDVYE